jgi:hypothetical protein
MSEEIQNVAGLSFECECGETYSDADAAWQCKKCRQYLTADDHADRRTTVYGADGEALFFLRKSPDFMLVDGKREGLWNMEFPLPSGDSEV